MCAAPIGNKFWKARSKHGRDTIFATPDQMLLAAYEYFEWNNKNPWYKSEVIKSGEKVGTIVQIPTERPLTIEGLCRFWGVNKVYFQQFEKECADKGKEDFSKILAHIRDIIYRQKYEGASVGAFNWNIISRDLGLKEHNEVTGKDGEPIGGVMPLVIQPVVLVGAPDIAESEDEPTETHEGGE